MYSVLDKRMLHLPGGIREIAELAHEFGFGGVGLTEEILNDRKQAREAGKIAEDLGLKWGTMHTPIDTFRETTTEEVFQANLDRYKLWAENARIAGAKYAYNHVWPSSDRSFEENFEWHVKRLQTVQRIMDDNGLQYGLEFLGPYELRHRHANGFVHTIAGVCALADAAGGKTGFLFDTWHWYCGSGRKDDLYYALQHVDQMVGLHVEDGVAGRTRDEQKDLEREMPMTTGIINATEICRMFREHGYPGPVCLEPFHPTVDRFEEQPLRKSTKEVAAAFERLGHRS